MKDFARLGLLIAMLMFSVQANERAKQVVRGRQLQKKLTGQSIFQGTVKVSEPRKTSY